MRKFLVSALFVSLYLPTYAAETLKTTIANNAFMITTKKLELLGDGEPKKGAHSFYFQYWDIKKKTTSPAKKAAPGLCEFRAIVKEGPKAIVIPVKSKYKITSTAKSPEGMDLPQGCLVIDAVIEGDETVNTPQLQVACCAEKSPTTDAQWGAFTLEIEKSLKPLVVFSK